MNVTPVNKPGPATDVRVAIRAESQPATAAASDRGDVRRRASAPAATSVSEPATTVVNRDSRAVRADRQTAEQLKAFISDANVRLNTYHDEASGRSILEVRDQVTGNVVSQYPSEELIRLFASLRQTLVDQSA